MGFRRYTLWLLSDRVLLTKPDRHGKEDGYLRLLEGTLHAIVRGMASAGTPYVGVLYAGLMVSPDRRSVRDELLRRHAGEVAARRGRLRRLQLRRPAERERHERLAQVRPMCPR